MRRLLVPLVLGLVCLSCGGAQKGEDSDWSPEPQKKQKKLRVTQDIGPSGFSKDPTVETNDRGTALLGVRHDLMLANGPHDARCSCLSVEVGRPNDPAFFWAGGTPDVSSDAIIVAIGARGIACPGGDPDDRRRRPSISAVDQEGEDIVIEIEDLPEGRPLASGAIIPRPGSRGSIYVTPRRGNLLYGRNPGVSRCRVR